MLQHQIVTEISCVSSSKGNRYSSLRSPDNETIQDGALRHGYTPSLYSREILGLLSQYAVVGLLYGSLPSTISPFLTYYLNMEGSATTSAMALLSIPWSLKVFFGMISDNVSVCGYRRRPLMVLGWLICSACLLYMAFKPLPAPYFKDLGLRFKKPQNLTAADFININFHAQEDGGSYILLMMFATLGYLLADCAADALVVDYAQREPEEIRGRTQTAVYTVRTIFMTLAQLILALGLSSPKYGGSFNFGISLSQLMLILAISSLLVIPVTWLCVHEKKSTTIPFADYLKELWQALQSRIFYQVIAYNFCSSVCFGVTYVAYYPMTSYWVKADSFSISLSAMIGNIVLTVTLIYTGKYGLKWNWRIMVLITTLSIVSLDAVCTMLTTFDILRSQYFWLGVPLVENVPAGISFIISTYVVVELAGEGSEGACYGLLTTVSNLGSPFASAITKNINSPLNVWSVDIRNDTMQSRRDVAITIWISYGFKLLSLIFLGWLPRQKAHVQERKAQSKKSRAMGLFTVTYLLMAFVYSLLSNIFSMFESTKCFKIAGGCQH